MREARHAATLSHPNICRIYEVGESQEIPFIVMELVEGRPLDQIISQGPVLPEGVIAYGAQIAAALDHAHRTGLLHRDLKSSNVVVDAADRPIVLDFGLARRVTSADQTGDSLTTRDAFLAGTLSHIAPEVLVGAEADIRSDIWSLGVLLHQLATGELPFAGRTSFEMTAAILGGRIKRAGAA